MKKIVNVPEGVDVKIDGFNISVGTLQENFFSPLFAREIKIERADGKIIVSSSSEKRKIKSEVGCIAAHIANMIKGIKEGFTVQLKIVYMHFPMTIKVHGKEIIIQNFLGERVPRKSKIIGDAKVEVKEDTITVSGVDKKAVGQTAANMERATKIKARDRRIFQD